MLPSTDETAISSVLSLSSMQKPVSDITNPTVQKPHCVPDSSTIACCTGVSDPSSGLMPSIVTMCLPAALASGIRHDVIVRYRILPSVGSPTSSVHAPQSPSRHPIFVPLRFL